MSLITTKIVAVYKAQRDAGATARQIYANMYADNLRWYERLDVLKKLYNLSDTMARDVALDAHRMANSHYLDMQQNGKEFSEIAAKMIADGMKPLDAVFTLSLLFGLDGREALRLLKSAT